MLIRYPALAYHELDNLFRDLLASNRGAGYGVSVMDAVPDLSVTDVELRFVAGRTYCCAEPGCHVPFDQAQQRLHRLAAERALRLPDALTVRWHCQVEEGAKLECHKSLGVPPESEAYDFVVAYGETTAG
jgi:hypothetical protein